MGFGFVVDWTAQQVRDLLAGDWAGFTVRSIAMYGSSQNPRYAVVAHPGKVADQTVELGFGLFQAPATVAQQPPGFHPKAITATGDEQGWLYSILFERPSVPPASAPTVHWMTTWEDTQGKGKLFDTKDVAGSNLISVDSFWFGQPTATVIEPLPGRPVPAYAPRPIYYCAIFEEKPSTRLAWNAHVEGHASGAWSDTSFYRTMQRGWNRPEAVVPSPPLYAGRPDRTVLMLSRGDTYEPWPENMDPASFTGGVECHGPLTLAQLTALVETLTAKGRWPIHVGAGGAGSTARFCLVTAPDGLRGPLRRTAYVVDALDKSPPSHVKSASHARAFHPSLTWQARHALETADDQALELRARTLTLGDSTSVHHDTHGYGGPGPGPGPGPDPGAGSGPGPFAALDQFALDFLRKRGVRVGHLAIAINGRLVFSRAYTWAEEHYPVATIYNLQRIGSVSKALTGTALFANRARLANGLSTDLPTAMGITDVGANSPLWVTRVEDVLRHRSGWGGTNSGTNLFDVKAMAQELGVDPLLPGDFREYLRDTATPFIPPGYLPKITADYSNFNFVALSEVASAILGAPVRFDRYRERMVENFFDHGLLQQPHETLASWDDSRAMADAPCHLRLPSAIRAVDPPHALQPSQYAQHGRFLLGGGHWVMTVTDLVRTIGRLDPSSPYGPLLSTGEVAMLYAPYQLNGDPHQPPLKIDDGQGRAWFYLKRRFPFDPPPPFKPGYVTPDRILHHNGEVEGGGAMVFHALRAPDATPSITCAFAVNQDVALAFDNFVDPVLAIIKSLGPAGFPDADLFEAL